MRARYDPGLSLDAMRALGIVGRQSNLEHQMEAVLHASGLTYRCEAFIGIYRADFLLPEQQGIIGVWDLELDGHPRHRTENGQRHDARRDAFLRSQGVSVYRVTALAARQSAALALQGFLQRAGAPR
jgi:very-short-patch-repair endonuclease